MDKRILAALCALWVAILPAGAGLILPSGPGAGSINAVPGLNNAVSPSRLRFLGNTAPFSQFVSTGSNPGTTRLSYTAPGGCSQVVNLLSTVEEVNPVETAAPNPVYFRAGIELPYGTGIWSGQFTKNGRTYIPFDASTSFVATDPMGISIPPGGSFFDRLYERFPTAPASPSVATAITGGSLAAATYYYKVTSVEPTLANANGMGYESNSGAEVSVAATGSTSANTLSWTNNAAAQAYRIYRSTASGTEVFLTQIPAPATGYLDTGAITPVSGQSAPSISLAAIFYRQFLLANEYNNDAGNGGNASDQTGVAGVLTGAGGSSGYVQANGGAPFAVLCDDPQAVATLGIGDSILRGDGLYSGGFGAPAYARPLANWFTYGMNNSGNSLLTSINLGISGSALYNFVSGTASNASAPAQVRLAMAQYADDIFVELGRNDIVQAGTTWQTIATNLINTCQKFAQAGQRCLTSTILPDVTSTDFMTSLTNQTVGVYESIRTNYNSWQRNGFQVLSGTPVLSGGASSPYIAGFFEAAGALEVNAAGTPTLNGGYWPAAAALATGAIATGTPTATSIPVLGAAYTAHALVNDVVKMTSGTYSGQYAVVSDNTSNTLTLYPSGTSLNAVTTTGLTGAPASGDTLNIYSPYSVDGTHPGLLGNTTIGAAFATFAATNFHR